MKPIQLACTGILILILLCGIASAEIVPDFSAIPTSGHAPLDVQFTDASTGGPTGWAWYFGDENYTAPWTLLNASSEWAGRDWHSSVATPDGSIVLTGGWDTNNKGDVWRSTNYGTTWALVNASPGWAARHAHSSVVMPDGSIVLTGGYSGGLGQNDTWLSTDNGDTWALVNASSGWSARGYHSSVAMRDGSIVLTGGRDSDGNRLNDTWRSTDYGATWTLVNASSGWAARSHHSTVMTPDGTIVLTGGYNGSKDFNDTWRSTDNGTTWKRVNASSGWSARDGHSSVVMPDGSIVLTGGGSGADIKNDTWRSTDRGATWTLVNASSGWAARGYHSSVAMRDGRIVQMGGYDGSTFLNDTWQLMPAGSSAENPSHTYTTPGNYKVALQAYNSAGYNSTRKSAYVTVNGGTFNISGTVYYAGAKTGPILVEAFTPLINGTFNSVGSTVISSPGPYSIAVPDGTCWLLATMDNQTGIQPTGSPINKSVYYRPDQLNVQNNLTGIDITLFEIPVTDNATFEIVENRQASTQGDSLRHGTQPKPLNITEDLHVKNTGDTSVLILDTMTVGVEGSDIADVGDPNTVWDSGHIVWDYPDRYAIQPDSNMGFGWKTDMTVTDSLPFTLNRSVNQSVFTAPAYQLLTFNASFDTMTCDWIYGNIAVFANSSAPVNATILNSTFQTDAPLLGFHPVTDQMLEFNLDEQNMQADRIYNFSVVLLVDPSQAHGQPVNYKPQILLAQGTNTGSGGGAMNDTAVMPADMLPATVTHAYLSNYFPTNWSYRNATSKQAVLKEVISIASHQAIDFTANVTSGAAPLTVQFNDNSTGSPTGWAWYFGDENYTAPWMQVNASAGWSARTDDSSVSMPDGSIVVMGGYNDTGSQLNDVWRSADDGATWTEMTAHAIWSGRWGQSSVAMPDGSIVLMGGDDGSANRNDVLRSTDNGAAWTEMNASAGWDGRYHHTSVAMPDGSIVLMGGYTSSGDINDVWRSTDNGATWTQQTASAGWSPRERPVSVVMPDGSIILMGGAESSGILKNDTWRSTDNGATWTQLTASAGWSPRVSFTSLAMPDGSIVLMGGQGYGGILTNDTWRSTDNGATWKQLTASAGWSQRDDQTSVAMPDGSIVLMGGQGYGGTTNDVWRLMPAGSSAQNPSHIYTTPGSYKVALQAYNAGGYNSTRKAGYITVTGNNTIINMSATIFIGEEGLNVTHALNQAQGSPLDGTPALTTIGWWASGQIGVDLPTKTISLNGRYQSFSVSPSDFVGYTGYWYLLQSNNAGEVQVASYTPVFHVMDPALDVSVLDSSRGLDVTGGSVPIGTRLGFRVVTNMYGAVDPTYRSPINPATDGYIDIVVKNQSGATLTALYNNSVSAGPIAGPISLSRNFVNIPSWYWNTSTASWQTAAYDGTGGYATPPGTYTVRAVSTLNNMKDNYRNAGADYTGKTVSPIYTITLAGGRPVNFTADMTTGGFPLTVHFTDLSSVKSPTRWNWSFGDTQTFSTTTAAQRNASHTYANPGTYTVNFTITNATSSYSLVRSGYISVGAGNISVIIDQSATLFIGEDGLNITHALNRAQGSPLDGTPALTTIGWWGPNEANINSTSPFKTIELNGRYTSLTVIPGDFVGYTGNWYLLGSDGLTPASYTPVFIVMDPALDVRVVDSTHGSDVTGSSVPIGTRLGFRVVTNMYGAVDPTYRSPINPATDGYINIVVMNQSGATLTALYNNSVSAGPIAGPISLNRNFVNIPSWYWNTSTASWQTAAYDGTGGYATPPGTYTIRAVSILNNMRDNYRNAGNDFTGKTVSPIYTITLFEGAVNFTANTTTGVTPLTVRFNITQTVISPTKWNWTFGDGVNFITTVSTQRNATHTYSTSGLYTVNLTVTNATGSYMALKPAYINVTTPALPQAEFRISRDMVVQSNSNSLSSGIHNISVMNTLVIRHLADGTGTSFGNLRYSIQTNNITWVQADQSAQWNDTSATWQFPGEFTIPENSNFGPSDATSETSFQLTNISLNRGFNQTRFNSTGYQFVGGNMTLTDMTGITSAQLVINMPFPSDYVNATIVPGSFFTDAPVLSTGYSNDMVAVSLDTSAMEPGTVYNFSSVYRVEPNGTTIRYKPEVSVTLGTYYNSSAGTPGYGADMPSYLLPENVTAASVGTDTVISWHLGEEHSLVARLNNRVDPLPAANFTANITYSHVPMVVRFNDISTGSPTAWNWSFGDGDYSELQNPVHTYTYGGNFTVSLNASNSNGFDIATKPGYIAAEPPSTDPIRVISAGGNVFIGESDLNITQSMGTNTTIAWFAPGALDSSTVPNWTIDVSGHEHAFTIDPVNFVGRNGTWYSWTGGSTLGGSPIAFNVTDPSIEIAVTDVTTGADPDGKTIPAGDQISFQLNTTIADGTTAPGVPLRIVVKRPDGTTYTTLVNSSGGATPLSILTNESVYATGPIWDTGNGLYPMGKYNITAIYDFNEMTETYPVVGRTIAQFRTINLSLSAPAPIQPLPAVKTASPSTGFNASTISFTLTGTDFQPGPGNTTVQFRNQTDILVPTLTNVTATRIDGTLVIPEDATVGPWNIRVVTDGGENTLVGKFAILQLMKPTITGSITPLTGVRTDLVRFTLGGTNFQPGAGNTNVTLFNSTYPGVITAQLGSVTPTSIAGNFTIPADAAFGKWFVNVTTVSGGTSVSLVPFTVVQQNTPKISTITPTSGFRNRTLTVALAGSNFQVGTGSNVSFFNQSYFDTNTTLIYANITSVTSTAITARVFFPDDAPVGPNSWLVNVTTVDGGTSTTNCWFTLLQPVPTITGGITPLTGVRTSTVTFALSGTNFQPGAGNTTVTLFNTTYPGVITAQLTSVTLTAIAGNFTIPADAAFGKWFANVTTADGGTSISPVTFTVVQQNTPKISTITPTSGFRNRTLTVALAGSNFQVGTGSNVSFFNQTYFTTNATSIYANVTGVTSTAITARVFFPDDAPVGPNSWLVNVTTVDGGTSTSQVTFTLLQPVPTITGGITPLTGVRTDLITFTLGGTNFQPGNGNTTVTLFNSTYPGVITAQLGSVTPTAITGNFTIPADAAFGKWFANVTTVDGGTSTSLVPFTVVQQNTPKISTITPTSGFRNRTLTVALAGSNFQVGTGSNVSFFNQSYFNTNATLIYANITTVTSTAITARVFFPDYAPVGPNSWLVNVTTVDGGTSTTNCLFTLLKPVPTITGSIAPATGVRTSTVTFALSGTNFQPGAGNTTVTLFNSTYPGVITAQLGSVTSTSIAGNFTIPADAAFGKWFVNVTTADGGTSISPITFSVIKPPVPIIYSITPIAGYPNSTVSYTLKGANFQPGLTAIDISNSTYGEINTTIYYITPTLIIGGIQIPANAPTGPWKLNATTDGGKAWSAFSVNTLPVPKITSFVPSPVYRDTTVTFILNGNYFQPGGRTTVNLTNSTGYNITTTLSAVYSTAITGTATIPPTATPGLWKVNVTTVDGGEGTKTSAVTIL
jgi:PKD repeat protein